MKKNLFKVISTFIMIFVLFCGCGANDKGLVGSASEYGELDMPWGECNYQKVGVIKSLKRNFNKNSTTAIFTVDGEENNKVKIHGTDMNIADYEGKKIFISAVENSHADDEYILVKRYQDITLENLDLVDLIDDMKSLDDGELNKVGDKIGVLKNSNYRDYIIEKYNNKVKELENKNPYEREMKEAYERYKLSNK